MAVPLLLLYPLQRRLGIDSALLMLVPLWPLWEWASHYLPLSLNTVVLSNSQSANVWLIQYADLFGAWAVTAWVVAINVVLYRAWVALGERRSARLGGFARAALPGMAALLLVPLAYAGVRAWHLTPPTGALRVTLISTDVPPMLRDARGADSDLERVVHITDSTAHFARQRPDLYVWSEGTLQTDWSLPRVRGFLYQAVDDWGAPLLTGSVTRALTPEDSARVAEAWFAAEAAPDSLRDDAFAAIPRPHGVLTNRAVLISPGGGTTRAVAGYDKTKLMPMQEGIPAHAWLTRLGFVRDYARDTNMLTPGTSATLLPLVRSGGRTAQLAAPICHEVNYPEHWAALTRAGADAFVQLNFESWFGDWGFQRALTGITRLRAIETRRAVARSANGGPSLFVDAFGRTHNEAPRAESSTTTHLGLRTGTTLYVRMPWLFPLLCALAVVVLIGLPRRLRR
jgi:apolipoprotein N-acyltransferase